MYRPPPNSQQYYSAPPAQVLAPSHWATTGAQFQYYHTAGPPIGQGAYREGMQGIRYAPQMHFQQTQRPMFQQGAPGTFQQTQGPMFQQRAPGNFQQTQGPMFQQGATSPFQQTQGPMFLQGATSPFQQTQGPMFQQTQMSPFQQIQGQPAQQTASLQTFAAQSHGVQPKGQGPAFPQSPPSHPQPPSSDVLKKKEKERLFREQQQRLKSTAITKTAKNPLDELFGAQSVKQATQEKAAPTLVQSSTSDDQLCGTHVKDTVGQLPTSDQPVEATAPVEPSKPSGREVFDKLLAESLDDLSHSSPSTKKRAQFKPTKAMFAPSVSQATFVQSAKARSWEDGQQFTGVFAELAEDDFGEFSSADPGLATVQEAPLQQSHGMSTHADQQSVSHHEAPQFTTSSAVQLASSRHSHIPTQQPQPPTGLPQPQFPTGQPQFPTGQPQFPAGQPQFPTGQPQFPAGQPQFPAGQPQFPTGQPQFPAGQPQFPTGQPQFPTGQPQSPTGQPQFPAGQPQFPTGQPQFPAGQPQFPTGQPQFPAGQPQFPTGQPQFPAGQPQFPAGQPQFPAGQPQFPAGQPQFPAGQSQVVQSIHPPIPSPGQHLSSLPLKGTPVPVGVESRQPTGGGSSHHTQDDWGSFTSFQDKPSGATFAPPESAQKDPSTHKESMGVSGAALAPSIPGSWMSSFSTLPTVYHEVKRMASLSDSIFLNTKTLSTIFASSGLPRPVLRDIWSEVSQTYRGKLVQDEMVMALALIALAQGGVKELKREAVLNLPQAPIPRLSAIQPADVSVAVSEVGSTHPCLPSPSDHPATLHQPTAIDDPDDFGAFQASNSFPAQKETAATDELPLTLQPVQLQKPLLHPALASTPPTAADSLHTAMMMPSSSTSWTASGPQHAHPPEQLQSGAGVPAQVAASPAQVAASPAQVAASPAQVAASPAPPMPSEVVQTSGDRYAAFRDLSASLGDVNVPVVESTATAGGGEQLGVSHYTVEEHKEQTAEATRMFSEPNNLERCLKVCHSLLQAALEAMTDVPPAVLEEVLATSHGQEKIKGLYEVYKLAERIGNSVTETKVDHSLLPALRKQWTQLISLNPGIVLIIVEPQPLPQDNSCAICKSQGPLPCVCNTVEVGGATCHVTCINFWYTFISE